MTNTLSRDADLPAGTWHGDPYAPWNAVGIVGECYICDQEILEDVEDEAVERRLWNGRLVDVCPECVGNGRDVCEICGEWFEDGDTACSDCNCSRPTHGGDRA